LGVEIGPAIRPGLRKENRMKKTLPRKLSLHRESLRQLETQSLGTARGGASKGCSVDGHSCFYGCPGYTLFGTCTC
jgi:hypothetical protein